MSEPWSKINEEGKSRSLIDHCLDVATTFHTISSRPILKRRFEAAFGTALTEAHLARLSVLAGLHDVGKALRGFQDKLGRPGSTSVGHVSEALAVIHARSRAKDALGLNLLTSWFQTPTDAIYTAICHHGRPVPMSEVQKHLGVVDDLLSPTLSGHSPLQEIERLRTALVSAFSVCMEKAAQLSFTTSAQHHFAGVLMVADWMASGFAFEPGDRNELAEKVLSDTRWSDWFKPIDPSAILEGKAPRSAQAALLELDTSNRLVVVESTTGSGKTEAALIWANRLAGEGLIDGLYFAVPTRSAATELHRRIGRVMSSCHPALKGKIVRAVPGMLDTDNSRPDYTPETWAVASPKRVFAAPIAVGTIDQALLSILRAKHAWMRGALLSRHLLLVDEVHASNPYMATLTTALIERHLSLGGYALAMSATLGETALSRLQKRTTRSLKKAIEQPYPIVRGASGDRALQPDNSRTVRVEIRGWDRLVTLAVKEARSGKAVLWIRSTVKDAVADFLGFEEEGVSCLLHHSRYAVEDRTWLDTRLMRTLGPGGDRSGSIAVTTQTAEQSLDIDADALVTDACPADVLLQRLGRLHRHRSGTTPTAYVIDPGELRQYLNSDGKVFGIEGQGWPFVYRNLLSVRNTLDWIRTRERISVPQDCRELVELATHPEALKETAERGGKAWEGLWRELFGSEAGKRQLAEAMVIDFARPYRECVVADVLSTRLGMGSVTVSTPGLRSPFTGEQIEALPIPMKWLEGAGVKEGTEAVVEGEIVRVGALGMRYDRLGVRSFD